MKTGPGAAKRNKQFSDYEVLLLGSGVSSVVRVPDLRLKGHGFESLQEQWENFSSPESTSVLTLIPVSVLLLCYHSSM